MFVSIKVSFYLFFVLFNHLFGTLYTSDLNDKGKGVAEAEAEPQKISTINSKLNPFAKEFVPSRKYLQYYQAKNEENDKKNNQTDEEKDKITSLKLVHDENGENKLCKTWAKITAGKELKGNADPFPPLPSNLIRSTTKIMEGGILQQNYKNILMANKKASSSNSPKFSLLSSFNPIERDNYKREDILSLSNLSEFPKLIAQNLQIKNNKEKKKKDWKGKNKNEGKEIPTDKEEFDWEQKDDWGVDWGLGIKSIEIKDEIKCETEDVWEDGECTLNYGELNKKVNDKAKIAYKSDSDLDWEEKADREIDWKIEDKKDLQTKANTKCESPKNSDQAWEGECKMKSYISLHPLQNKHKVEKNKFKVSSNVEVKNNNVKLNGKNVENDLDWEQKADLLDQINWKKGLKKIKKSDNW